MVSVCFYLHVHQPIRIKKFSIFDIGSGKGYFDEEKNKFYLDRIARKSYIPTNKILLELIKKYDFKVSFSITGVLLEQLEKYAPEVLKSFQDLVDTGNVELVSETYYHSLAWVFSKDEFRRQVKLQEKKLKELFGQKPKIFRNTELIYNDDMGKVVSDMGYKAVMTEGTEKILEWRSPCYVYEASGSNIKLLLKHYRLSDDIAFRFSTPYWNEYPLTADKYASWINATPGNVINIFMDYETFGEHQWKETGIFEFLKHLPREILKNPNNEFVLPSEVIKKFKPVATISVPFLISWADTERDLSAWIGNEMQRTAARELYSLENDVLKTKDKSIISDWRKLQTADHFYYMCTKWFADGDIHKYFNPYESPYEAFISFMNILNDLKNRIRGDSMSKYLENVPDDKVFWCRDGQIFKNLKELLFGLEKMSDETFKFHVSKEKNDFANWIRDVIGDEKLAKDIMKSRTKKSLMKKLSNRIKKLEK
ncbi:MAG: glycoside hydrolase family 57 protein [Candidatus Aenigmarchaeota archaeon]|nr:glycoside hydrolase family 57 protein [Candidatus Aenigmarchaeota archaeon]